ncbi:U-box domain-containing protein [Seminavis robusta]|uniref:U-box domain-containing protein n=1 Tax=Seminavis robusta TaxID=568900 RepID=A0A9N8HIZ3_9STRA|nr:U-box domain-containing protein [Seminavis robusta]|eukprot:Sro625_g177480.1 U-box domain-containing protein (265) ;mRNA; r:7424-8218
MSNVKVLSNDDNHVGQSSPISFSGQNPATDDKIPRAFICPLTLNVMQDPVMDAYGSTYERSAIVEWLAVNNTSPVTRQPLAKDHLVPNRALRDLIYSFMGPQWSLNAEKEIQPIPEKHRPVVPVPAPPATSTNRDWRGIIDSFLEEISRAVGKNIRLNDQGICAFTYEHLTIVIEVPQSVGSFFLYTELKTDPRKRAQVLQKAMALNYLQQETRGGCMGWDKVNDELMFSYSDRVNEINATDFRNILENYIDTALSTSKIFKEM